MPLRIAGLGHGFAGQPDLFTNLSMTLEPGRVYALTGPSGSGKSTLLGILAGWIEPQQGWIDRNGVERIGWVFQNPHGVARRTALDHVVLPFLARGMTRAQAEPRAMELLDRFDLLPLATREFRALSGGEAQRLMLARGMAAEPDLFLVDEPTAQLDVHTAATVNATLGALSNSGSIVVVATHDARTRKSCSDHIDLADYA